MNDDKESVLSPMSPGVTREEIYEMIDCYTIYESDRVTTYDLKGNVLSVDILEKPIHFNVNFNSI